MKCTERCFNAASFIFRSGKPITKLSKCSLNGRTRPQRQIGIIDSLNGQNPSTQTLQQIIFLKHALRLFAKVKYIIHTATCKLHFSGLAYTIRV